MQYLCVTLALIALCITIILIYRRHKISKYPYVIGTLISVDLCNDESKKRYEASYKYEISGRPQIYLMEQKKTSVKKFNETIKLYYKEGSTKVFEKPSIEIILLSISAFILCFACCLIYFSISV